MTKQKPHGLFRRGLDAFIASRERQARIIVSRTLLSLDDNTLKNHGYNRSDLIKDAAGWNGY